MRWEVKEQRRKTSSQEETVKTVEVSADCSSTSLKRGVNERYGNLLIAHKRWLCCMCFCFAHFAVCAAESWESALNRMPLEAGVAELSRTNCVDVMLKAFQSNDVVKAMIFMPGATDEFYMFKRAKAQLTNTSPTLLDAVSALTNQTLIRATFQAPFLLLHSDEDPLDLSITVESESAVEKLKRTRFVGRGIYNDRDWDFMQPILRDCLKADIQPWRYSRASWHFYRHSFAAWNLTGWEALEAVAFAGKTRFKVSRKSLLDFRGIEVEFKPDARIRSVPTLGAFPR
jgi:hypothetical protein